METMTEAAVAAGLKHFGFSPHSPVPIDSHCNMSAADVAAYLAEVGRLREIYGSRIRLYSGMEIDFLGEKWGPSDDFFRSLPLDYRIGSVHFIPSQDGMEIDVDGRADSFIRKMHEWFHDDIRYVVDTFFNRSLEMIAAGGFDILGHFDKIGGNASAFSPDIVSEPFFRRHVDDMIDAILQSDIIVEVNTKAYEAPVGATVEEIASYHPRLFPSSYAISQLIRAGVPLVVNSDAHFPDRIVTGRRAAFAVIEAIAQG